MANQPNKMVEYGPKSSDSGRQAFSITPSDTNIISTRGLYIGGAGNVVLVLLDQPDNHAGTTFTSLAAGVVHPLAVKKVLSTGTTATGIVGII